MEEQITPQEDKKKSNKMKIAIAGGGSGIGKLALLKAPIIPIVPMVHFNHNHKTEEHNLIETIEALTKEHGVLLIGGENEIANAPLGSIAQMADAMHNDLIMEFKMCERMLPDFDFLKPIPNKLQLLRDLELSPEQLDYFKNAPPHRLDGETQKDYKNRRMLNNLIVKYRGLF